MESTVCTGFICDNFEGSALDARWASAPRWAAGHSTPRVRTPACSPVHLYVDAINSSTSDPYALIHTEMGLPLTGRLYSRAWVYLKPPQPTTPLDQIIDFSTLGGLGISTGARDGVFVSNDYTSMMFDESATTLPLDTWFCLQFEMPSGTSGSTYVSVNGSVLGDITLSKASTQPAPDQVYIGIEWAGTVTNQPMTEASIDDVIVSTSSTTCAQE